jgi:hypothetical protein
LATCKGELSSSALFQARRRCPNGLRRHQRTSWSVLLQVATQLEARLVANGLSHFVGRRSLVPSLSDCYQEQCKLLGKPPKKLSPQCRRIKPAPRPCSAGALASSGTAAIEVATPLCCRGQTSEEHWLCLARGNSFVPNLGEQLASPCGCPSCVSGGYNSDDIRPGRTLVHERKAIYQHCPSRQLKCYLS